MLRLTLLALGIWLTLACSGGAAAPTSDAGLVVKEQRLGPPILAETQAVEAAVKSASFSRPELGDGKQVRATGARLMTYQEWEDRFTTGRSCCDRDRPVWVVRVEGEWQTGGIVPPEARQTYTYGAIVLDARTGEARASTFGFAPVALEEAVGLDADAFARYPLDVSLERGRDLVDFSASEPAFVPDGFVLERVTLELALPLQETTSYSWRPNQTLTLRYSDGKGRVMQVSESRAGQPGLIGGAQPFTLERGEAWRGEPISGATWVGWTAAYPHSDGGSAYVTYFVLSPDGSLSLDLLQRIAESFPPGMPPNPTATPVTLATREPASPEPTATPTPFPIYAAVRTSQDMEGQFDAWPDEYKFRIDEDTVVLFAHPSPIIDWAWQASIRHIPSMSTVSIHRPRTIRNTSDGSSSTEPCGELVMGQDICIDRHYESEEGRARLDAVLADPEIMSRILEELPH